MSSPSVSYSITVRLEMPAQPSAVSTITTTVEHAGGVVTAVDVFASGVDRLQVDVTCATGGEDDAKQVVDALGTIAGVVIGRVSDRTFLAHLGGKIEIQPKMQIRHRDDLSLIYTPGVGRVSQQLAAHPEIVKGYLGPDVIGPNTPAGDGEERTALRYLLDPRVVPGTAWVTGANEAGKHVYGLVAGRDFEVDEWADLITVQAGDPCPHCGKPLYPSFLLIGSLSNQVR